MSGVQTPASSESKSVTATPSSSSTASPSKTYPEDVTKLMVLEDLNMIWHQEHDVRDDVATVWSTSLLNSPFRDHAVGFPTSCTTQSALITPENVFV